MSECIKKSTKDIFKTPPENVIVLGDVTFKHPYFKKTSAVDLNDVLRIRLRKHDFKRGNPKLNIEISTKSFKISVKCESVVSEPHEGLIKCESVTCDDFPLHMLDDLFPKHFLWIVKNIAWGLLTIEVVTTLEKMPINVNNDIMMWIFPNDFSAIEFEKIEEPKKFYAKDFFKELKGFQNNVLYCGKVKGEDVQHEGLFSDLRPYQCRAVQWMLERECGNFQVHNTDWLSHEVTTICGKKLYYYPYSKVLMDKNVPYGFPNNFPSGILADEMGLGKTLVIIALILNHPRDIYSESDNDNFLVIKDYKSIQNSLKREFEESLASCSTVPSKKQKMVDGKSLKKSSGKGAVNNNQLICVKSKTFDVRCVCGVLTDSIEGCVQCPGCSLFQHTKCVGYEQNYAYFCPSCWPNQKLIKSTGTLIVAPTSIYNQWKEEIKKHVDNNAWNRGVFMFSSDNRSFIQPSVLASYDIVITTYTSLPSELPHTVQKRTREFRHKRQYLRKCSPLALIQWWRVCLDEAQLVEAGSPNYVQISEMAKLIPAINRWSVTGTPIQKSVNDLYYLFNWMGIKPFEDRFFWDNYLYKPHLKKNSEPLFSILSQVFWRNSKEEVDEELNIPEQTTEYHILKFTPIEQTFYMEQHADVMKDFLFELKVRRLDLNRTLDSLDRHTMDQVLNPLLNLRQACSHHLAVGNQFEYMMEQKKGVKNKIKKTMRLDALLSSLQDRRKNECEDILKNYFYDLNGLGDICSTLKDWPNAIKNYELVLQLDEEYKGKGIKIDVLQKIHAINQFFKVLEVYSSKDIPKFLMDKDLKKQAEVLEVEFLKKPMDEYDEQKEVVKNFMKDKMLVSFNKYFQDGVDGWWAVLIKEIIANSFFDEFIEEINKEFEDQLEFLKKVMTKKDMKSILKNWLKRVKDNRENAVTSLEKLLTAKVDKLVKKASSCHFRKPDALAPRKKCKFCRFELNAITYEHSLFVKEDNLGEDVLKSLNEENLLKLILNFGRMKDLNLENCLLDGQNFFRLLKIMKEEVEQFILIRNKADKLIRAKKEIDSSKSFFLELNRDNGDIQGKKKKFEDDVKVKESEMRKKYGSYLYLKTLGEENNENRECPVCLASLEDEWCILPCGHSYCCDCIKALIGAQIKDAVRCSICREVTQASDVGLVSTTKGESSKNNLDVIGNHSTKVKAVVKIIKDLKEEDSKVKIIIFSTWEIVLKILRNALSENGISHRDMIENKKWKGKKWEMEKYFEDQLREFKDPYLNITAFLLPLHLGSKGLNLIEATHVFLIEPILNPAEELQAIGRVHRMGQTKKTVVHRFLVKGTIEEKIHSAVVSKAKEKWDRQEVTLGDLKNLFGTDKIYQAKNIKP